MKRELLTTSNKAFVSQSRNGKYRLLRSSYRASQFLSFESNSSNSATYEETFAMHEAESARALDTCATHRMSMAIAVKWPAGSSHRLFGTAALIRSLPCLPRASRLLKRANPAKSSPHSAQASGATSLMRAFLGTNYFGEARTKQELCQLPLTAGNADLRRMLRKCAAWADAPMWMQPPSYSETPPFKKPAADFPARAQFLR